MGYLPAMQSFVRSVRKNCSGKVFPSDLAAVMDPKTAPVLIQLNVTGLAPPGAEPKSALVVVQPAPRAISRGKPDLTVGRFIKVAP